jgi:hypothetical protein
MILWILSAKRPVTAFLLALLAGCQTWQPTTGNPQTLLPREQPTSVRLTLPDGALVTISDPVLRNDSIVSQRAVAPTAQSTEFAVSASNTTPGILSMALADIRSLEVRRFSLMKTIAFAAVIVGISLTWANTVGVAGGSGEPGDGPEPKG